MAVMYGFSDSRTTFLWRNNTTMRTSTTLEANNGVVYSLIRQAPIKAFEIGIIFTQIRTALWKIESWQH